MAQPTIWRSIAPTESGTYWFYGTRFPGDCRRMRVIEVHRCSKSCGYMSRGMCCDVNQMQGLWRTIEVPPAPSGVRAFTRSEETVTHGV